MFKTRFFIVMCMLMLPGCFDDRAKTGNKHTFFVQMPLESAVVAELHDTLWSAAGRIIKEELGIDHDRNFPIFYPKKRQAITTYYIRDLYDRGDPIRGLMYLFVVPAFNSLGDAFAPKRVSIGTELAYFGEERPGLFATKELVVLINDADGELAALNKNMKSAMHHTNIEYKRAYGVDLYDINKSEQHDYLPHLSLGHLRVNYIKYLVNDASRENEVAGRIEKRILEVARKALADLVSEDQRLLIEKISVYSFEKKKYVEELALKN